MIDREREKKERKGARKRERESERIGRELDRLQEAVYDNRVWVFYQVALRNTTHTTLPYRSLGLELIPTRALLLLYPLLCYICHSSNNSPLQIGGIKFCQSQSEVYGYF